MSNPARRVPTELRLRDGPSQCMKHRRSTLNLNWLHQFTFLPTGNEGFLSSTFLSSTSISSWEICMQVKKQQLEPDIEQQTGSKSGRGYQGCILSPCLFNLYAEYIMRKGWKKHKLESRLPKEISITSDMQMTPPLRQKVKRNKRATWWTWKRKVKKLA